MANTEDRLTPRQRNNLRFYFAMVFGVILGAVLGPLVFTPLGMKVPVASVTGAVVGVICGYIIYRTIVSRHPHTT